MTVADDLLKNDGKKFLEMMERLAERRMQREEEAMEQRDFEDEDEEYEDDDEYEAEEVQQINLFSIGIYKKCILIITFTL